MRSRSQASCLPLRHPHTGLQRHIHASLTQIPASIPSTTQFGYFFSPSHLMAFPLLYRIGGHSHPSWHCRAAIPISVSDPHKFSSLQLPASVSLLSAPTVPPPDVQRRCNFVADITLEIFPNMHIRPSRSARWGLPAQVRFSSSQLLLEYTLNRVLPSAPGQS